MPLIDKMLRYPDELKAMGLAQNGLATSQGSQEPSEESIKNTIIDIHKFLTIDLGLTHVPTIGELDLDNINDLDLVTKSQEKNIYARDQFLEYGFKVYGFNDDLQEEKPLFIKFYYGVINLTSKFNQPMYFHRFMFFIKIDIIHNEEVLYSYLPSQKFDSSYVASSNYSVWNYYLQNPVNSIGFYTGDRLFLNLLPNRHIRHSEYALNNFNSNKLYPFLQFYIERNEKYIKLRQFTYIRNVGENDSSMYSSKSANFVYIPYNKSNILGTSENCNIPYVLNNTYFLNAPLVAFRTIDIHTPTSTAYENYNVMVGYNTQVQASNVLVDIKNGDDINKYYIIKTNDDYSLTYTYSSNLSMMLKVD